MSFKIIGLKFHAFNKVWLRLLLILNEKFASLLNRYTERIHILTKKHPDKAMS